MAHGPDLVLAAHQIDPRVYELSGLRTGSVRDQMIRSVMLVSSLKRAALVDSPHGLLIVGSGAAGITAAMAASVLGIPSTLVERTGAPLWRQASVRTRFIDPAEYDWPQPHWTLKTFPLAPGEPDLPLEFKRARAEAASWDWQQDFHNFRNTAIPASNGALADIDVRFEEEVVPGEDGRKPYDVRRASDGACVERLTWDAMGVYLCDPTTDSRRQEFGALLSCVGFGEEDVGVPLKDGSGNFLSSRFWESDQIESRDIGLPRVSGRIDVLVSGGGDGAQQDIQRVLTRKCGRDLYQAIVDIDNGFPNRIDVASLALADDLARRAHAWSTSNKRMDDVLGRWHQAYEKAANEIWQGWGDRLQAKLVQDLLRESVAIHLTWLVGGKAPTYSFGLNRLLTWLVLRLHERATSRPLKWSGVTPLDSGHPIVVLEHRIEHVAPTGHTCQDAASCYGKKHEVRIVGKQSTLLGEFEIILIRHGLKYKPLFGIPPMPEQTLPFGLPG